MWYKLAIFEQDEETDTRTIVDLYEVSSHDRSCETPAKAVAKLMKLATQTHGDDLINRHLEIYTRDDQHGT